MDLYLLKQSQIRKKKCCRCRIEKCIKLAWLCAKTRLWRLRQRQEAAISCQRTQLDLAGKSWSLELYSKLINLPTLFPNCGPNTYMMFCIGRWGCMQYKYYGICIIVCIYNCVVINIYKYKYKYIYIYRYSIHIHTSYVKLTCYCRKALMKDVKIQCIYQ